MPDVHPSPVANKKDFFISYTGVDLQWARWIDAQLKAAGLTTVIQFVDFHAGGDFLTEMEKAVRGCHRLMPVFTLAHFRSPFCQLERNAYLALDPDGSKQLILPVVVEPCEDLGLFRSRIHIDISTLDEVDASRALLAAVKRGGPADLGPITFPGKPTSPGGISTAPFPRRPLPPNNLSSAGITPNESHVPRAVQMAKLEKALTPGSTVALTQALQGDGGFGKTEIAKAYLYAHARDFDGLWWLDASAEGHSLATDKLATALGIDFPPDIERGTLRREICRQLSQGRHLLVLDNLDDPTLLAAWPLQPPAVRLVTTRLHGPAIARLHSVKVAELRAGEARALLRQYRDDPAHDATFNEIATLLGHHALALTLAGAWLGTHVTATPERLLEELKTETGKVSREVLAEMTPQGALGETYARSVVATLTLHLGELKNSWSRSVLEIAAFLHPGGIPIEMLAILSTHWPLRMPGSEVTADDFEEQLDRVCEAVEELHSRSLLTLEDGAVLHRMAQRAMRASMNRENHCAALQYVLKGIAAFLADTNNPMKLAQHAAIIPHATVALPLADDIGLDLEIGYVAANLSSYYQNCADFESAIHVATQAESHFRAAFGDEHEAVAVATNNRGYILREMGDLEGALQCHTNAERINRNLLGNHHPNVARDLNNRGGVLQEMGDLDSALCCYEEADGIFREAFVDEHPDLATVVNNRGCILELKGDLNGALRCFDESEHIDRKTLGSDHPNVARTINNRGKVLLSMGNLKRALSCFQEAEEIDRAVFGSDDPNVARDVNNRGMVLKAIGDLEGALRCLDEGERIDRNTFGDNHSIVAQDVMNRGMLLIEMGDMSEAMRCFEESKRINRMSSSDAPQCVSVTSSNQCISHATQEDRDGGLECAQNILHFPRRTRPEGSQDE